MNQTQNWSAATRGIATVAAWITAVLLLSGSEDGRAALVVIGVALVLAGAEWIVTGMRLGERWRRILIFTALVVLLCVAFVAVVALAVFLRS